MFSQYRYISARTLLEMPKLDRCQSLPQDTWTPTENLWLLVFISHRWGSQDDPDPSGSQLATLKLLVQSIVEITDVILDERIGLEATQSRLARIPSIRKQGILQAAHFVFRILCYANEHMYNKVNWQEGNHVLDVLGFWYDYSCLPQDPKTPAEQQEFAKTLQSIEDMLISPRVSTLVLRKEGDGYLNRGWCVAESVIAYSKDDTNLPIVLRSDRWSEPFSVFSEESDSIMAQWEDSSSRMSAWEILSGAIQTTAMSMILKRERSRSEFSLALSDTLDIGHRLLAKMLTVLTMVFEGDRLDLSIDLANLLKERDLGCRDNKDYILVSLLLLKSVIGKDAVGDIAILRNALIRFTKNLPLNLVRHEGTLVWYK